jgi:hypothetical protein
MAFISYDKQFCYINIRRTGSSSVIYSIKKRVPDFKQTAIFNSSLETEGSKQDLSSFYIFSLVRNPYDLLVSAYCDCIKRNSDFKFFRFNDFLDWVVADGFKKPESNTEPFFRTQTQLLSSSNDLQVNVYKYESLSNDAGDTIINSLYSEIDINKTTYLPLLNKSERNPLWSEYYDEKSFNIVNTHFADDFKNFNYKKYEYEDFGSNAFLFE